MSTHTHLPTYTTPQWLVGQGKLDASAKDQLLNAFKRRIAANQ